MGPVFTTGPLINLKFEDTVKLYPIQIPWQWIMGSANPFRHKVFFVAASDFYRAPGPSLLVQPRLGLDLYVLQCTSK